MEISQNHSRYRFFYSSFKYVSSWDLLKIVDSCLKQAGVTEYRTSIPIIGEDAGFYRSWCSCRTLLRQAQDERCVFIKPATWMITGK